MEQVMSDCGDLLNKRMDGTVSSPAAIYAHAVLAEDFILNGMLYGRAPIFVAGQWSEKTGVPAVQSPQLTPEWAAAIQMKPEAFGAYAKDVWANTDKLIEAMSEAEAEEQIQTPFGNKQGRLEFISNLGVTHAWGHLGEIAALKGLHGLKGLPF
jgi:hypothetical protein